MKIKMSKQWWVNLYVLMGAWIMAEVFLFVLFMMSSYEDPIMIGVMMVALTVACICAPFSIPLVVYTIIELNEGMIKASLFGKKMCEVSLKEMVYYAIFESKVSITPTKKYIAISNSPFSYTTAEQGRFFLDYDRNKQILVPYNEKTRTLVLNPNWVHVNSERQQPESADLEGQ